jgi:hypothetical protein
MKKNPRITQSGRSILIHLHIQPLPPPLTTIPPPTTQKLLIRVTHTARVVAHDDHSRRRNGNFGDEGEVLVVDEDELRAAVGEDVGDFAWFEANVDWGDDCSCGEDAVVCIYGG